VTQTHTGRSAKAPIVVLVVALSVAAVALGLYAALFLPVADERPELGLRIEAAATSLREVRRST